MTTVDANEFLLSLKDKLYFYLHEEGNNIDWDKSQLNTRLKCLVLLPTDANKHTLVKIYFESELSEINLLNTNLIVKQQLWQDKDKFPHDRSSQNFNMNFENTFKIIDCVRRLFN